jgi:hypothetical protein
VSENIPVTARERADGFRGHPVSSLYSVVSLITQLSRTTFLIPLARIARARLLISLESTVTRLVTIVDE